MYLFDTNIATHLRDSDSPEFLSRFAALASLLTMWLSSWVELEGGVTARPATTTRRRVATDALLQRATIVPLDADVVRAYGAIVAQLGFSRPRILDRLIAATAMVHDLTLVTMKGADVADIPDLRLEVWPVPAQ